MDDQQRHTVRTLVLIAARFIRYVLPLRAIFST
jgi:hypothetical protein